MTKHLWEIKHPYYCNDGNYFASGAEGRSCETRFKSWADFLDAWGDADFDMNLVFRFDWTEDPDTEAATKFKGDPNYRNGMLSIRWMGQRKGLYQWSKIEVCRADEPAVIEWLRLRWDHMRLLWEGLSDVSTESQEVK